MYPSQEAIARDVKREVMAELQPGSRTGASPPGSVPSPHIPEQTYRAIKESVKSEVLAEIKMQQLDRMGLGRPLSDRRIQQMVDARYQAVDDLKADIKRELSVLQEMESRRAGDPQIRQIADNLAEEARKQGLSHEQLLRSLDRRPRAGGGTMGRISEMINTGQRRGFLYGVGMMLLCNILLPSARSRMHSVAVRSLEEGMAMVDRARSFISGQDQQGPPLDPAADQGPPPEGDQPPVQ